MDLSCLSSDIRNGTSLAKWLHKILFKTNRAINSLAHTTPNARNSVQLRIKIQTTSNDSPSIGPKNLGPVIIQEPIKRLHAQNEELSPQHCSVDSYSSWDPQTTRKSNYPVVQYSVHCVRSPSQPQLSPCAQKKPSSANIFAFIGNSNIHDDAIGLRDSSEPVKQSCVPSPTCLDILEIIRGLGY